MNVKNKVFILIGGFWLFSLLNPVFKKYDYGAEFPLVCLFGVLLVWIFWQMRKERAEKAFLEKSLLGLFMGFFALSFVFSETRNVGFSEVLAYLTAGFLYWILAFRRIVWRDDFVKVIAAGLLASIVFGSLFYLFNDDATRMYGSFYNVMYHSNIWPNAFGLFILLSWPMVLLLVKRWNWRWGVFLGAALAALVLSFSRGAFLAFIGQCVLLAIYQYRAVFSFNFWKHLAVVLVTAVVMFFGLNTLRGMNFEVTKVEEKVEFANNENLTSKQERMDFWLGAVEMIKEKPWLGYGSFSFRYAYNPIQKTFLGTSDHPHNFILKIGAENGLLALGSFLGFLVVSLVVLVRRFKGLGASDRSFVALTFIALSGGLAHSFIDYNFNFYANLLLFFILLALLRSTLVKEVREQKKSISGALMLTFLSLLAAVSFYEGAVFSGSQVLTPNLSNYSLFPRWYLLDHSEKYLIKEGRYEEALEYLDRELKLNELDAQAYYLKGKVYCSEDYAGMDLDKCHDYLKKALSLDSMNKLEYYKEYLLLLEKVRGDELLEFAKELDELMAMYKIFVRDNVHYTGMSKNVIYALDILEILERIYPEKAEDYARSREEIVRYAEKHGPMENILKMF